MSLPLRCAPLTAALVAICAALVALWAAPAGAQQPWSGLDAATQIRLAVQAAPQELRDGAAVQGYDRSGAFVGLRPGVNELICMAPNPSSPQLEVSCHHAGLEPFFARGRALAAQGVSGEERVTARWREWEEGRLSIPYGAIAYVLTGTGFDAASGAIEGAYLRWVIYTPMATTATTGIPEQPSAGGPWLMLPGTPGAHIMITPPRPGGGG